MPKNPGKKTPVFSKIIIVLVLVVMIPVLIALARETHKKIQIQKEIEILKEKARQIDKSSIEIQDEISYLESQDYQEKEAKDKLNLQNPQENVVVIKPSALKESPPNEERVADIQPEEKKVMNPIKWWQYFFKN